MNAVGTDQGREAQKPTTPPNNGNAARTAFNPLHFSSNPSTSFFSPPFPSATAINRPFVTDIPTIVHGIIPTVNTAAAPYSIPAPPRTNGANRLPARTAHDRYPSATAVTAAIGGFCALPRSYMARQICAAEVWVMVPERVDSSTAGTLAALYVLMFPI